MGRKTLCWSFRQIGGAYPTHKETEWIKTVIDPVHSLSFSMLFCTMAAEDVDQHRQAPHLAARGRVLEPAHGRLQTEIAPA